MNTLRAVSGTTAEPPEHLAQEGYQPHRCFSGSGGIRSRVGGRTVDVAADLGH